MVVATIAYQAPGDKAVKLLTCEEKRFSGPYPDWTKLAARDSGANAGGRAIAQVFSSLGRGQVGTGHGGALSSRRSVGASGQRSVLVSRHSLACAFSGWEADIVFNVRDGRRIVRPVVENRPGSAVIPEWFEMDSG